MYNSETAVYRAYSYYMGWNMIIMKQQLYIGKMMKLLVMVLAVCQIQKATTGGVKHLEPKQLQTEPL